MLLKFHPLKQSEVCCLALHRVPCPHFYNVRFYFFIFFWGGGGLVGRKIFQMMGKIVLTWISCRLSVTRCTFYLMFLQRRMALAHLLLSRQLWRVFVPHDEIQYSRSQHLHKKPTLAKCASMKGFSKTISPFIF